MTMTPDALLRFAGPRDGTQTPIVLGLAGLRVGHRTNDPVPATVVEPVGPDPVELIAELQLQISTVNELARRICETGLPDSAAIDAVTDAVEAVLVAVIGDAVDADRLGLRRRVQHELAHLGSQWAEAALHVAPADAALLAPGWAGPPALFADPTLERGCFEILVGQQRVMDSVSSRLATCLRDLREP